MSVTQNVSTKTLSTGIVDPQGSVVATSYTYTPEVENGQVAAPVTMWSALESFDEYGNKLAESQDKSTGALNYSWLGGKERATDLSGLVLMGVRLYNSVTGQFTSVDPVKGGNTTAYAYPQDPINQYDLDGNALTWKKSWNKKIGRWVTHKVIAVGVSALAVGVCVGTAGVGCLVAASIAIGMPAHMIGGLAYDKATRTKVTGKSLLLDMAQPVKNAAGVYNKYKKIKHAGKVAKPMYKKLSVKNKGKHAKSKYSFK